MTIQTKLDGGVIRSGSIPTTAITNFTEAIAAEIPAGIVSSSAQITSLPNGLVTNAMVNASAGIVDTKLATISTAGKVSNSATTATNNNTASAIVARDANGDFAARDASLRQVILRGDTSGTATIKTPAVAGTPTFTLPAGTGSSGQFLQTNGSGVLAWAAAGGAPYAIFKGPVTGCPTLAFTQIIVDTEVYDPANFASVSSNYIFVGAGSYWVHLDCGFVNGITIQGKLLLADGGTVQLDNSSESQVWAPGFSAGTFQGNPTIHVSCTGFITFTGSGLIGGFYNNSSSTDSAGTGKSVFTIVKVA